MDLILMVVGTQMEMEVPMDMVVAYMVIVDQMEMETPHSMETLRGKDTPKEGEEVQMVMGNAMGMGVLQIEEEDFPEEMGIQMEEMEVLTLMIVGMGMMLHPHQTPYYPEEEGIGDQICLCAARASMATRPGRATWTTWTGRKGWQRWASSGRSSKGARTNLDTTGLENPFSQFGRTMSEVLKAQQRTNQNLEEQFKRANETQVFQTEAMQDMAQANF